jgi:hypothetical protein
MKIVICNQHLPPFLSPTKWPNTRCCKITNEKFPKRRWSGYLNGGSQVAISLPFLLLWWCSSIFSLSISLPVRAEWWRRNRKEGLDRSTTHKFNNGHRVGGLIVDTNKRKGTTKCQLDVFFRLAIILVIIAIIMHVGPTKIQIW